MRPTTRLYALSYREARASLATLLFVAGNMALPQLCHLLPQGGYMFLPIYFFTLVAAYKCGWQVGVATAVLSPLVNSALFGMPPAAVLPSILIKSTLLALIAATVARRTHRVSLTALAGTVVAYQLAGSAIESLLLGSWALGFQDFRLGIPGMLLQVFGGYALLGYVLKR